MTSEFLSNIPGPGQKRIALHVTASAEQALRQGHPWIFDQAIRTQNHDGQPGDLAVIFDRKDRFLAIGLYDPDSNIRVRILHRGKPETIDQDWFTNRLKEAARLRSPLMTQPPEKETSGYRLVNGENDGLPGLIVDRYAATLVIKLYTAAWLPHLKDICSGLKQVMPFETLVLRLSRSLLRQEELLFGLQDGVVLSGKDSEIPVLFKENGITFEADPLHGQKTGFFLDQRDNRARVEALSKGKSVLNLFAYTGGFSVYAARGEAREVVSVDISSHAIQAAERNMAHNQHFPAVAAARHLPVTADVFEYLAQAAADSRFFDLVIIDPPSFARKQSQVEKALSAYQRLTRSGLKVLKPGGTLVQASCSNRIEADPFFSAVHQAASGSGRPLQEIERTGHALDHPVGFSEGAYLKCLFATAP